MSWTLIVQGSGDEVRIRSVFGNFDKIKRSVWIIVEAYSSYGVVLPCTKQRRIFCKYWDSTILKSISNISSIKIFIYFLFIFLYNLILFNNYKKFVMIILSKNLCILINFIIVN